MSKVEGRGLIDPPPLKASCNYFSRRLLGLIYNETYSRNNDYLNKEEQNNYNLNYKRSELKTSRMFFGFFFSTSINYSLKLR